MGELSERIGLTVCPAAFSAVAQEAEGHSQTRDPFDRLVVAQASLHDAPLLTADTTIRAQYSRAILVNSEARADHRNSD